MRNVIFRCAPALSAPDAKKIQTILSSTAFTMAQYTVPLDQEIRIGANSVFFSIEEYVRVLFINFF